MRLSALIIIIVYSVLLLTDAIIVVDLELYSLKAAHPVRRKRRCRWWIVYSSFALLVIALFSVALFLPREDSSKDINDIMWMLYVVTTVLIAQVIYCFFSLIGKIPMIFRKRTFNTGLWFGLPASLAIFAGMWYGTYVTRHEIETKYVDIKSQRLPHSFDGYTIAQISDLHLGTWGTDTIFVSNLVDSINHLHPDLIVFTGDIVNRIAQEVEPFMGCLSRLNAPDGVISILGNHDYGDYVKWEKDSLRRENLALLKDMEREMGWEMLNNAHKVINHNGESIYLIGVENWGEPPFTQYGNLKKAYPEKRLRDDNFKILLSHNPEHWNQEVTEISNIDLTLAGHTHAMQIMIAGWSPAEYRYTHWGGLYTRPDEEGRLRHLYVNTGAGEVGIPMRMGVAPEITLITLKSDSQNSDELNEEVLNNIE